MKIKRKGVSKELIAFAYVQEEYARTGDISAGLMPIFAPIIHECAGQIFNSGKFAEKVQSKYDIAMRPIIAESLIPKLEEAGLLIREQQSEFVAVYRCATGPQGEQRQMSDSIKAILDDFSEFAQKALKDKELQISADDLRTGFMQRLMDLHFIHDGDSDAGSEQAQALPNTNSGPVNSAKVDLKETAVDILCAEYISNLSTKDPARFLILENILAGALIAEVVLTMQQPTGDKDLSRLQVVVDGPLIMDVLDLNTPEHKQYAEDLLDLLKEAKVKLVTFKHIVEEIHGSIYAPLTAFAKNEPSYGPLAARLQREPHHATYARAVLDGLDDFINNLDIEILDARQFAGADYLGYCSEEIEDALRNCLGPLHKVLERRIRDASSIASVMRMRQGGISKLSVAESKYVFVTRNVRVAYEATKCLLTRNVIDGDDVPPCILDRQLAGILWFCLGGSGKKLSREMLLANCMDALYPRPKLLSQVRSFLNKIDADKAKIFEALMRDKRAQRFLVHKTFGYVMTVSQDNVEELLEEVKRSTAQDVEQEAREREKQLRDTHEKELSLQEAELSRVRDTSDRLERERDALLAKRDEKDMNALENACKAARVAERKKKALVLLAYFIIVAIVAYLSSKSDYGWWIYVLGGLVGLLGFWFVPDKLFNKWIDRAWNERLLEEIEKQKIEDWDKRFDLNRTLCRVTKKTR